MRRIKNEFNLQFIYNQTTHSISKSWKDALIEKSDNNENLVFQGDQNIK